MEPLKEIGLKPRAYYLDKCGHTPWHEKESAKFFKIIKEESKYLFQSERLGFRHFNLSDEASFLVMNSDKEVMRYFPNMLDEKSSKAFLERIIDKYQAGYGLYAVEVKASGELIGFIGLSSPKFEMDFTPCVEIGWRLMSHHWRKGYAKEGAKRVLDYAFNHLNLKEIVSFTSENNTPSIGVMKSIGMTYSRDFDHPNVEGPLKKHVLYKISK
ncbi:GNAT family N-acetyltransferase [Acidaminobacter sp. JC074]|nr:GNAT family N-acetyltransferase [Acidaminobacter sp. JC074]